MPTYDYECQACGHRFEELQSFSASPLSKCPACKKNKLQRLFGGGGAIIFKGSGFYETDYRRSGESKSAKAEGDAPKTEAKSASASESSSTTSDTTGSTGSKASGGGSGKPGGGKKKA